MSGGTVRRITCLSSSTNVEMVHSQDGLTARPYDLQSPVVTARDPTSSFEPIDLNSNSRPSLTTDDVINQMANVLAMVVDKTTQVKTGITVRLAQLTAGKQYLYQDMSDLYRSAQNDKQVIANQLLLIETNFEAIEQEVTY